VTSPEPRSQGKVTRPVMRYHGGKFMLRGWIVSWFQPHRIYTEVYGGGASVLLAKPRSFGEVYNDLDRSVCRLFRVLRDPERRRALAEALWLTPFSREEYEAARGLDLENVPDDIEAARLLLVRSFQGHGTEATTGATSTGFRLKSWSSHRAAPQDWQKFPDSLRAIGERLRGVEIENRPAVEVLRNQDADDALHYVDPPYVASTRGKVRGYNHEMTEADHAELAGVLRGLAGHVILSGYPCELYDSLYHDWYRVERGAFADGAAARVEVLWSNRPFYPLLRGEQGLIW
jgi:DNA adenine methylase